jgi:hypothetical protein
MYTGPTMWRTAVSGTMTNGDLLGLVKRIGALHEDGIIRNGLIDLRALSDMDLDYSTLNTIMREAQSHTPRNEVRTAFIAMSPIQYCIARMFQTLLNRRNRDIQVCEDEKDAIDWLQSDNNARTNTENVATNNS